MNMPVFLNNGCTVSIMPKSHYDHHEIENKCLKMPTPDFLVIHTCNGNTKVHFWIVILLMM